MVSWPVTQSGSMLPTGGEAPGATNWAPLKLGGGGWLTGMDISVDGTTKVVRTDTYGGYILEGSTWRQLVTDASMPSGEAIVDNNFGIYELRVAPNTPATLYMSYNGYVYKSTNSGTTWVKTAFPQAVTDANDSYRMWGEKMAVDPLDANHILVGTPADGLYRSTNGGTTWNAIVSLPVADSTQGITGIVFDAGSTPVSGRTGTVYASSYGNGIYISTNSGVSFALLADGPTHARHAIVAPDHVYWAAVYAEGIWKYDAGWTNYTPISDSHSVAADPFVANRIIVASDGGHTQETLNDGTTWTYNGIPTMSDATIPWQSHMAEPNPFVYLSNGNQIFDPVTANKLWMSAGTGVWTATLTSGLLTGPPFVGNTVGIEQLVALNVVAPLGGKPIVTVWDREFFRIVDPTAYPSTYVPAAPPAFRHGWDIDYVPGTPSTLVGLSSDFGPLESSGISTDGGVTWTNFATTPAFSVDGSPGFGNIAASTSTNFVWVPSNQRAPYYTTNGGSSWTKVTLPGVPDTDGDGGGWDFLHHARYYARHIVCADRVTQGTFYMYHYSYGLFRSTDGGASWTRVFVGEIVTFSAINAKLRAVPGKAGHLFFTAGSQSGDQVGVFKHSTNGGSTWSTIANVVEVYDIGFGKAATVGGYPMIFIAGWVSGVYGIYRSTDEGASWTMIEDFPMGSLCEVRCVNGDMNTQGTVYVGTGGHGFFYGTVSWPAPSSFTWTED